MLKDQFRAYFLRLAAREIKAATSNINPALNKRDEKTTNRGKKDLDYMRNCGFREGNQAEALSASFSNITFTIVRDYLVRQRQAEL